MEVELVSVQVQAQIKVDAYAVAAGAGLGRRKNPPGWQQQAGGFLDWRGTDHQKRETQSAASGPTPATTTNWTVPRYLLRCSGLQLLPNSNYVIYLGT